MAMKVTKTEVWVAEIKDVPGGLADCLEVLTGAGANLECLIARRQTSKPGTTAAFVTPLKGRKVGSAASTVGFRATQKVATLRIEGGDKRGIGSRIARTIGDAGVNMRGLSAAVVGRKFVCYVGFDSKADADAAAKALRRAKL